MSSPQSSTLPSMRLGAILLAVGGLLWWLAGSSAASTALIWLGILGLLVTVPLIWYARKLPAGDDRGRTRPPRVVHRGPYLILNLAQLGAIVVIVTVCVLAGGPWLIPGLIAIVNGAHFLPLGRWLAEPSYARLGVAVLVIGILGTAWGAVTLAPTNVLAVVGLLVAISYWMVPTVRLLQLRRQEGGPSTTFQFIATDDEPAEDELDDELDDAGVNDDFDDTADKDDEETR